MVDLVEEFTWVLIEDLHFGGCPILDISNGQIFDVFLSQKTKGCFPRLLDHLNELSFRYSIVSIRIISSKRV